jgi:alpha-ribazole phosphatase
MRVALVRHPTPLIAPGICYGRLDVPVGTHASWPCVSRPSTHERQGADGRDTTDQDGQTQVPVPSHNGLAADNGVATGPDLSGAVRVWTSPARRCRGVAEAIARALSVPLIVDPRLQELDFGEWEGRPWDAIARADLDRWAACPWRFAPPGGESGAELVARVCEFHAELREDCVVVSHGGPLKVLAALLAGTPIDLLAEAPPLGSIRIFTCAAP